MSNNMEKSLADMLMIKPKKYSNNKVRLTLFKKMHKYWLMWTMSQDYDLSYLHCFIMLTREPKRVDLKKTKEAKFSWHCPFDKRRED